MYYVLINEPNDDLPLCGYEDQLNDCFLAFITIVLRNLCSGTHRRNRLMRLAIILPAEVSWKGNKVEDFS